MDYAVEGQLIDLLPQYGVVVSMNSMGLLHAVLLGIPAISYQPGLAKPDVCITNKVGLSPLITSFEDLRATIRSNQFESQLHNRLIDAKSHLPWLDGNSTERIYRFLEGL
jgi:hypothetical protein